MIKRFNLCIKVKRCSMRINKYIASCGICSRRKAEEYIVQGRVWVNGKKITDLSVQINEISDEVCLDHKQIVLEEKKIYLMLNKPLFPYAFPHFLLYFTDIIYKSEVLPCQQRQSGFLFCLRCCIIGLYDMPFYGWTGLCEKNKNGLHTLFWKEMGT